MLLVEDEPSVRRVIQRVLKRAGFEVIVADTPAGALEWLVDATCTPDLLLSDVVMPDMSGPELYRELEKRDLHLPVIFMSGYTGNVLDKHGGMPVGGRFLNKPFDIEELTTLVREIFRDRVPAIERRRSA